jgi:hypothetical protein
MNHMNLTVIKWLLAHRDVLMQIVAVAKDFSRQKPYIDQWNVVDKIARILIPVLSGEEVVTAELMDPYADIDYLVGDENDAAELFAMGAEVQALGVDWRQMIELILPIVIAIFEALAAKKT